MTGDEELRIAGNEATLREVNEAIARGVWPGEDDEPVGFRCECGLFGCDRMIELTVREYEDVRMHSRRFILHLGHELEEIETVVDARPGYVVVEKEDRAGVIAEASDPRG